MIEAVKCKPTSSNNNLKQQSRTKAMVTPEERRRFHYFFNTQKRCLTALALIDNVLFYALRRRGGLTSSKKNDGYLPNKKKLFEIEALSERVAITHICESMPDGASKDKGTIRTYRDFLEGLGLWKTFSQKHPQGNSPPCLFAYIDLRKCLIVGQWLYAQFHAHQHDAILSGTRKVLEMPKHHFAVMAQVYKAIFHLSFTPSKPRDGDELSDSDESREIVAKANKQQWYAGLVRMNECFQADIDQCVRLGIRVTSQMRADLARVKLQLERIPRGACA